MKVEIKKLTMGGLDILQRVDSGIFKDANDIKSVMEYTYVCSAPIKEVLKASKGNWDDEITLFSDQFTLEDVKELTAIIESHFEEISKSQVEPVTEDKGKKD